MKQVINQRGTISVREVAVPQCGPGEIKISLTHSLISSGTEAHSLAVTGQNLLSRAKDRPDLVRKVVDRAKSQGVRAAYDAIKEKVNEPKAMGYSATGVVVEVGKDVTRFAPGDRVACGGSTACHAEVVCVPENLVVLVPAGVDVPHASFTTLGSIAMQGIRRARPEFGEAFVVLGLGLVGLLCVQMAKAAGVRSIGFDFAVDRVRLAQQLGAHEAYSLSEVDALERVSNFTQGIGADAVIVTAATKSSAPVNQAVDMARERGRIAIVGVVGLKFQHTPLYMKELDVVMSRSYGPGRYDVNYEERGFEYPIGYVRWTENRNMIEVLRLIKEGKVNVAPLISSVTPIDKAEQAYASLQTESDRPLAIVLEYPGSKVAVSVTPQILAVAPKWTAKPIVTLALVGCGGFCKKERLPYLRKSHHFKIASLISGTGSNVKELAAQYGVAHSGTDYRDALADPSIDCLLVATPNSLHGPMAIDAAKAGKDLFVEKPMAVNPEELEEVYRALKDSGVRYACGFNRRFAPASERLKAFIDARQPPYNILYRCNAGLIRPGHMMHPPEEGGGLIVGEACHLFDYCTWLVGKHPIRVTASVPSYGGELFVAGDNLSAIVKYEDGSIATIIYTTMGHDDLRKERVEAYAAGAAAVMDDYSSLTFHGVNEKGWSGRQDKGHKALIRLLGEALTAGKDMPIGLEASYLSHVLTFKAMESARTGGQLAL